MASALGYLDRIDAANGKAHGARSCNHAFLPNLSWRRRTDALYSILHPAYGTSIGFLTQPARHADWGGVRTMNVLLQDLTPAAFS